MILIDAYDNDARTTISNVAIVVRGHAVASTSARAPHTQHAPHALARLPIRRDVSRTAVVRR